MNLIQQMYAAPIKFTNNSSSILILYDSLKL